MKGIRRNLIVSCIDFQDVPGMLRNINVHACTYGGVCVCVYIYIYIHT